MTATRTALDESVVEPAGSEEATPAAAYRPHLDGLRALAVYLVVVFHAGSGRFSGGYIGVDVFFVLSGFLVTQLLLRDLQGRETIRLGRFYARRFRRLLPAAFVTLIVTAIVYSAIASPVEIADAVGSFKAAFLYCTNWYFIHESAQYFGADIATNPVLQFWSLAVEEQFYLVWPLLFGGAFALTRRLDAARRLRVIRIGVAVAALASAAWALSLRGSDPNRAYYGTDARAYELLAGALIALVPTWIVAAARFRRSMRGAAVVGVAALLVLASSWVHLDAIQRGVAVTLATGALIVAIETADGGMVRGLLSSGPVVYLGKISYGTYLWHWLVILFIAKVLHLSVGSTIAIACVVATAFAALSYELLERPVRMSGLLDRHRKIVIASGLAISIVSALVIIPKLVDPATATPSVGRSTAGFTAIPSGLDWEDAGKNVQFMDCLSKPASQCILVRGTGPTMLLIGDSHAAMFMPTFAEVAAREHLTLAVTTRGLCPWQQNLVGPKAPLDALAAAGVTGVSAKDCLELKRDLYGRVIPELRPDVIVAVDYDAAYENFEDATIQSTKTLVGDGRRVVLVEDTPNSSVDPRGCLSKAKVVEECRYVADTTTTPLEVRYRLLDDQYPRVFSADFDGLVCPFLPICDPVIAGRIVKIDYTHITSGFAEYIAPQVATYLEQTVLDAER
jgi:peptidoglycan/LPS O-acetylase OafA/YrhL